MLVYICSSALYPKDIITESSSSPGKEYITTTATMFNEAVCGCPGFHFRGSCKHIDQVEYCDWWSSLGETESGDYPYGCPQCGGPVELYETDPKG